MTVRDGVLVQTSVSEIESFDIDQEGGCPRRWWFERAMDLRAEQSKAQEEGEAGHAHLAHYFLTGERPRGRKLMGKAAMGAIVKGALPAPGDDLLVELRFSGQPKHDAAGNWIPLDEKETLHLAGVPLDGFIDLTFRRGPIPEVWDHKFFTPARPEVSPDPYAWLKKPSQLIKTVQMPVYVISQIPFWPDAREWRLVHHCVSKKGVDSQIRSAVVTTDQVLERKAQIESVIERMKALAPVQSQEEVPFNRRSCHAWQGCPHQSICSTFKKETVPAMPLSAAEDALFADIDFVDEVAAPPPAPAAPPPPAAKPPRRNLITEAPPLEGEPPAPEPVAAPAAPEVVTCACGEKITPENGSRLQSGGWKHIGCKLDAPKVETPAPRARKPKTPPAEPAPPPVVEPAAATAPVNVPAIVPAAPAPAPVAVVLPPMLKGETARLALAETFEGIAKLLRSVA